MVKISAEQFSREGDKYLGRSYEEMDCQEFVERCMADAGLKMDLKGSNAWYREVLKHGWIGTPEQCKKKFGSVPKGALLFIHAFDGGEIKRGYHDDFGNASHIGIKTGRGKGAIHSSSSRGGVVESEFNDKTIRNGGWNRVGLYNKFTYGKTIDWVLDHIGIAENPAGQGETKEDEHMTATVYSENGNPVNLRKSASKSAALVDKIPVGTDVEIISSTIGADGTAWSKVKAGRLSGWMMTDFLSADDSALPPEDFDQGDLDGPDGGERIALYFTADELAAVLPVLENAVDQIVAKVGRG